VSDDPGEQDAADDLKAIVRRIGQDPRLANVRDVVIDGTRQPVTLTVKVRRGWWRTVNVVFVLADEFTALDVERAVESAGWV
jgi:hypothetical protein